MENKTILIENVPEKTYKAIKKLAHERDMTNKKDKYIRSIVLEALENYEPLKKKMVNE